MVLKDLLGKGKRTRVVKDFDRGKVRGFRLTALSIKGEKTIRYLKRNISNKNVKGIVSCVEPLVVDFFYSSKYKNMIGSESTFKFMGLLLKGEGVVEGVDYNMELIKYE